MLDNKHEGSNCWIRLHHILRNLSSHQPWGLLEANINRHTTFDISVLHQRNTCEIYTLNVTCNPQKFEWICQHMPLIHTIDMSAFGWHDNLANVKVWDIRNQMTHFSSIAWGGLVVLKPLTIDLCENRYIAVATQFTPPCVQLIFKHHNFVCSMQATRRPLE